MKDNKKRSDFSIRRAAQKLNDAYERDLEKNDPIYLEPIHKKPEEEESRVLCRGGIDVYFLVIVLVIALFGVIMSYSVSSYTAEWETGDSLYYVKKHILFLALSCAFTALFIIYARPWFWRVFGIAVYGLSILLLLAVLVVNI